MGAEERCITTLHELREDIGIMRKYVSPITSKLTPDNWQDQLNLKDLSLDDLTDLLGDLKAMEAFGKKVGGFIKEAVYGRMPDNVTEHTTPNFCFVINERTRAGSLNKEKILEDMGEEWVEEHTNAPTEYKELRMSRVVAD